jgi:predicted HTH transcriptional regulator
MVEIFNGRIEISNPGAPLVDVERLIDESPRSRNENVARLMRQIGYCEERGSGIDKIIDAAEVFQLPPPAFEVKRQSFVATLHGPRAYAEMSGIERIRASYQHACLMWVSGRQPITNATLRQRFGLEANRASEMSRLLREALDLDAIKPADPANQSRAQAAYIPFWA